MCGRKCCSRAISIEQGYQACGVSAGATIRPCCSQGGPSGAPQASHAGSAEQGSTKGLAGCCAAKDPGLCMCQVSKGADVAPHRQPGDNREAAGATEASVSCRSCIDCRVLELCCMSLPWQSSKQRMFLRSTQQPALMHMSDSIVASAITQCWHEMQHGMTAGGAPAMLCTVGPIRN